MNLPNTLEAFQIDVVGLEKRRDELANQLEDAECMLWTEMVNLAIQLKAGKSIAPAAALVLARNDLPDFEDWD